MYNKIFHRNTDCILKTFVYIHTYVFEYKGDDQVRLTSCTVEYFLDLHVLK